MEDLQKEFVPYEFALRMKQLGFDEPCMASRDMNNDENLIQIPLYQQAFRWFREKYGLFHKIDPSDTRDISHTIYYEDRNEELYEDACYWTYEEAELACLEKLIEIVEQKEKI